MHPPLHFSRAVLTAAAFSLATACAAIAGPAAARADYPESILHTFNNDGGGTFPKAGLTIDGSDTLYGTTHDGGLSGSDAGELFDYTSGGNFNVLHVFGDGSVTNDGIRPTAPPILDQEGDLIGTTTQGGQYGYGTVYERTPSGAYSILHSFKGGPDGQNPSKALTIGNDGRVYGVTVGDGSSSNSAAYGTVFSMNTDGGAYLVQYQFGQSYFSTAGGSPSSPLVPAPGDANVLYGATSSGGKYSDGTIFSLVTSGTAEGASITTLHSFPDPSIANDGQEPDYSLALDASGNLYGTTDGGGADGDGTVYKLAPNGTESILYDSFGDDALPTGLSLLSDGNLYGTQSYAGDSGQGIVYSISPTGGNYRVLYHFASYEYDGEVPVGAPVEDSKDNIYGTTAGGGVDSDPDPDESSNAHGTIWQIRGLSRLTSITVSPNPAIIGSLPKAGVYADISFSVPVPSSGADVQFTSSNTSAATIQSDENFSAGTTSAYVKVIVNTSVTSTQTTTLTATYNGISVSTVLTVSPPPPHSLASVTLAASSVAGGAALSGNRVSLTSSAVADTKVTLTSSNAAAATVPASETILKGSASHSFTVTTYAVTSPTLLTITATCNGVTKTATLTVVPSLSSIKLAAGSAKGGTSLTGNRIYFTGNVNADTPVTLTSSNTSVATVPSTETILSGTSSHSFTVTTKAVTSSQTVTITAMSGGIAKAATLTVTP